MGKTYKILILSLMLCLCLSVVACGKKDNKGDSSADENSTATLDLQISETMDAIVGFESKLDFKLIGSDKKVTFSSSDKNIATVSDDGMVKGINVGECNIIAKVENIEKQCSVTVKLHSLAPVLNLNSKFINLHIGDEYKLFPQLVHLDKVVNVDFVYQSENQEKVSVSEDGKITANEIGKTNINISYSYIGFNETVSVEVNVIEDIEMALSHEFVELVVKNYSEQSVLPVEEKVELSTLKVGGVNIDNPLIVWKSANNNVCIVEKGNIKSVAKGETEVTAKYVSEKGTESICRVKVVVSKEIIDTEGIALADYTWDYGLDPSSDKMFIRLPDGIKIAEQDIVNIKYRDSDTEIGEKGSLWIKKSEGKEEKYIVIETKDYLFNVNLKVESSKEQAYAINFDPMSFLPTQHAVEVEEFQGRTRVIKTQSLSETSKNGDIWYNHNGIIRLNSLGIKVWRGMLCMDVWINSDKVKLGGYINTWAIDSNGKDIQTDNIALRYQDEGGFNLDFIKVIDTASNKPGKIVANKWNRIVMDLTKLAKGYEDEELTEISFYPSFARAEGCKDEIWEAYISNFVYMTPESYRAKYENEKTYTISFNTFSPVKLDTLKVKKYSYLSSLPVPEVEGNVFSHWEYNGKNADGMVVSGDIELNAVYKNSSEYDVITYQLQLDGTFKEIKRKTLTALVGKKVVYTPQLSDNFKLHNNISVLSGYIIIGEKLQLKVYVEDTSMYPDDIKGNGVTSIGNSNVGLINCTNGTTFENGIYDSTRATDKGAYNRRLAIYDANSKVTSKDYIAFLAIYFDGTSSFDFKVLEGSGKEIMDSYDLNFNYVKEKDRKIGEWYYIVTRFDGNNQSYFYLSDWYDVKLLIKDVYVINQEAKNKLFTLPTEKVEYTITTYTEQDDGTYLQSSQETKTGNIDETITIEPTIPSGYIVNSDLSLLTGVLKDGEQLQLKVYFSKEKDTEQGSRTTDGSFFTKEDGSYNDFVYEKKAYNGNNNTYYCARSGNGGSYGYKLAGEITNDDLNKYMLVKIAIPKDAKTYYLYKAEFWQDGIASPYPEVYHCMDFYKADGTVVDEWSDFRYDEWFYCSYFLDSEKVRPGKIAISFAAWIDAMEIYVDTVSFVQKEKFESTFDYMPTISGEGIKSSGIFGMLTPNNTNNDLGNLSVYNVSKNSGVNDRQVGIWGNNYFDGESYIVFTMKYDGISGSAIDFATSQNGGWVSFDFYDANLNLVKKEDRKAGQWYFVVSSTAGHNNNNIYKFADEGVKSKVTFGNYYVITKSAKDTKFSKA